MYKFKFLIALALLATSALAQSALDVGMPPDQGDRAKRLSPSAEREQRRAELRQALRSTHAQEAPAPKPAASDSGRFIVQVGAFADAAKAKETRLKVERAGLTTYIHVAETPEGKRTRVRVGPFSNRADAEKAAAKIRGLDLPAAILTL
mgnify:CR=1 FL=1